MDSFCPGEASRVAGRKRGLRKLEMTKITLEPQLELLASDLNAHQCAEVAMVYARWAHQLQMKAKILRKEMQVRRRSLVRVPKRKLKLN